MCGGGPGTQPAPLPGPRAPRGKKGPEKHQQDSAWRMGLPEAASAGPLGQQEWDWGGGGQRLRTFLWGAPLCHSSPDPLPLTRVEALAPKLNQLSSKSHPQSPALTPFLTRDTPPPKSSPSPGRGIALSKQNAVGAAQVETNPGQLSRGMARVVDGNAPAIEGGGG